MSILSLLIVILLGGAAYLGLKWFKAADVRRVADLVRKFGAVIGVFAVSFVVTRNIGIAIFLAMLAYSFFSRQGWFATRKNPGQASKVRTAYLEMVLDHDSGAMSGQVLQGAFAGRALSNLSLPELLSLLEEVQTADVQSVKLLETYLNHVAPSWADARASQSSAGSSTMSLGEAYLVLGLNQTANRDDVQTAHRNLMKRFHPDQGGSTYIASKLNEAKAVLLKHIS